MKRPRGFTLIEAAIVIAVIAVLAVVAGSALRAGRGNAGTASTAYDLALRLQGLKTRALTDQARYVLVLMNPTDGDSRSCGRLSSKRCLRWFLLSSPTSTWSLNAFTASSPGTNAALVDRGTYDAGVVLDFTSSGAAGPVPFDTVTLLDPSIRGACKDEDNATCQCVAVQFTAAGEVNPVLTATPATAVTGMAFGITSGVLAERSKANTRRAMLVSSPTGMVKTYTY